MLEIILTLFVVSVLLGMTLTTLMLIGCSIYDMVETREKYKPARISKRQIRRYRPLVSIIIPTFNEELTINRCLNDLRSVRYRKLEIIVSDDKSSDDTKKIVREYIKNNPKRNIRLIAKRKNGGRGAAINLGIKYATGEIIVAFDADCRFEPDAVHKLVARFVDKNIQAVAPNVRVMKNRNFLGLLQQFEYLIGFRSKKFNTLTKSEYIIGGAGASYRVDSLQEVGGFNENMKTEDIELSMRMTYIFGIGEGPPPLVYASDYVVHTEPVPNLPALFRQRFRWKFGSLQALFHNRKIIFSLKKNQNPFTGWIRLPMAIWSEIMLLLEPILLSFFIFIAIHEKNPWLFISACMVYAGIAWLAIWSDEHYNPKTKISLTLIAPTMYIATFLMTLVQIIAAFRSLIHIREILGIKKTSGSYIPTQRAGKPVTL